MLSRNQTMDGIVKQLKERAPSSDQIIETSRSDARLILSVSSPVTPRSSLARSVAAKIRSMRYKSQPKRVHFSLVGEPFGTFCDSIEALVICDW